MAHARTTRVLVGRIGDGPTRRDPDELAVEEPLTIRLDGSAVATTMRTPGNDFELAVGFCHGDGLLGGARVRRVQACPVDGPAGPVFNVVDVDTGGVAPPAPARLGTTTSSCGLCGSTTIDDLRSRLRPLPSSTPIPDTVLATVAERVRARQELFDRTGAVHAAAAFDVTGEPLVVREDVGRHNAVDKVVGRLLLDGALPATGLGLFVSGRASFELVQKAWAAGFGVVLAVSAPTSLAVDAARAGGVRLVGFARGRRMNVYADPGDRSPSARL